jgi:N-acetylglucosaminyldiphosphoundecaprenol N-acetyl-beta-D-mannosaminyltransferase
MLAQFSPYNKSLDCLPEGKILISTLNAHSYNVSHDDPEFEQALLCSDVLLADGVSIGMALRFLTGQKIKKIAGADLFEHEMSRLQRLGGKAMFLGSAEATLEKIRERAAREFPNVRLCLYSPPFKPEFSAEDDEAMISAVCDFAPDVLFVGMTAPKQEKWAYHYFERLAADRICCIGAVFDFYAGTKKRAPRWMIRMGLEWLYRLLSEPGRLGKRYLVGNSRFVWTIAREKFAHGS